MDSHYHHLIIAIHLQGLFIQVITQNIIRFNIMSNRLYRDQILFSNNFQFLKKVKEKT